MLVLVNKNFFNKIVIVKWISKFYARREILIYQICIVQAIKDMYASSSFHKTGLLYIYNFALTLPLFFIVLVPLKTQLLNEAIPVSAYISLITFKHTFRFNSTLIFFSW